MAAPCHIARTGLLWFKRGLPSGSRGFVMLKLLFSSWGAEWGSAALVFLVSATVGRFAAEGMNSLQWFGALVAVLGSITVAVAVRVWPNQPARAKLTKED